MRTMAFCLAAILLALFDSGPALASAGKDIYTMNLQVEHKARDSVLAAAEAPRTSAVLVGCYYVTREAVVVVNSPPVTVRAPIVYFPAAEGHCDCCHYSNASCTWKERPFPVPIVHDAWVPTTLYRQTAFTFSYR